VLAITVILSLKFKGPATQASDVKE